jgi:DNA (cytosine-5)-methyltransferase 1
MKLRYATVCSGIEAMSVAVRPLGWEPVWFSEIEPFACTVLDHHYPHVSNVGDMLKIKGKNYAGKIDIIAGGTPCQSFSTAGLHKGLADKRGQLSTAFAKLARDTQSPWLLWENVYGALVLDKGIPFARILQGFTGRKVAPPERGWKSAGILIGKPGHYSVAWRVLDCQYTRVAGYDRALPQCRRRIWLVGYRGTWTAPAEILIGAQSQPPILRPDRVPPHRGARSAPGSAGNPIIILGDTINRLPTNEFIARKKGFRTGASFTIVTRRDHCILAGHGIRRMTALEAERLQGFQDGYTDVPYKGRGATQGKRMFAIGNSWPVNCARWVCSRIDDYVAGRLQDPGPVG